jgi:serine/threonine protein kinase/tetratricopeptide (TPR) repeat protein
MIGTHIGSIRLTALLGEGGMGTVHLGFDEKLERRVAVKTLRPQRRLGEEARARFLREARLLSRLDHPNICRVYDLVEGPQSDHLVLEYLEGRTLRTALDDAGTVDVLRIGEQVARALAAAHSKSIVHRDLKPDNVILTDSGEVKVLDFGIARSVEAFAPSDRGPAPTVVERAGAGEAEGADATVVATDLAAGEAQRTFFTEQGAVLGTIRYMSPEQASGGRVTPASDMYALGLLLQEMATGATPYGTAQGRELLAMVGRGQSRPADTGSAILDRLIEELKTIDPAARPTAEQAVDRLREIRLAPQRRRRRRLWAGGAAAAVLATALTGVLAYRLARPVPLLAASGNGRIALLPFINATNEPRNDWVELGLAQMVIETVGATDEIEVVPIDEAIRELKPFGGNVTSLTPEDIDHLIVTLGVELVVTTTVLAADAGYALRYEVYQPGTRAVAKTLTVAELTSGAAELSRRLALRLRPDATAVALTDRFSDDPYVNRTYAMGVQQAEAAGPASARSYFEVCLDRDPAMDRARLGLAKALYLIGETDRAQPLLEEALAGARDRGDNRLEADIMVHCGRKEADQGDYDAAQLSLARALELARASDDRGAEVAALSHLGRLQVLRGEAAGARAFFDEAREVNRELESRAWEARLLNNLAVAAYYADDLAAAEEGWTAAQAVMREIGHRTGEALVVGNLGLIREERGDLEGALAMHREELAIQRELGDRQAEVAALYNVSVTLLNLGRFDEARQLGEESLALAAEVGNQLIEILSRSQLGLIAALQGELDTAVGHLRRALSQGPDFGSPELEAAVHSANAYLQIRRGELVDADHSLRRAEAANTSLWVQLIRSRWHYANHRFDAALTALERARETSGEGWPELMERELTAYRTAARLDQPVPLPSEIRSGS